MHRLYFISFAVACVVGGAWWFFATRTGKPTQANAVQGKSESRRDPRSIPGALPKARALESVRVVDYFSPDSRAYVPDRSVLRPIRYRGTATPLSGPRVPSRIETLAGQASTTLDTQGAQYRVLSGVVAVPEASGPPSAGASMVGRNLGFAFYETPDAGASAKAVGVVYNTATRSLGVVTGALSVKWSAPGAAEALAQDYQLKPVQTFDQLSVTYYQSSRAQMSDLLKLQDLLKHDQRVVEVNLQILERLIHPQ